MKLSLLVLSVLVCASTFSYAANSDLDVPVREEEPATIGIDLTLPEGIKGPEVMIPMLPEDIIKAREEQAASEKAKKEVSRKKTMSFSQRAASEANPKLMENARVVETKDNGVYKRALNQALAKLPQSLACKTKGSTNDSTSNLSRVKDRISSAKKIYVNTTADTIILEERYIGQTYYGSKPDLRYTYIFLDPSEKHIVGIILTNSKGGKKITGTLTNPQQSEVRKCSYGYVSSKK
jgi:hypothetical protein